MLRTTHWDATFPSDQRFQMGMNWRAGPILCQVNSHALSDRDGGNFLPRATTRAALLHLINDERWGVKPALGEKEKASNGSKRLMKRAISIYVRSKLTPNSTPCAQTGDLLTYYNALE